MNDSEKTEVYVDKDAPIAYEQDLDSDNESCIPEDSNLDSDSDNNEFSSMNSRAYYLFTEDIELESDNNELLTKELTKED